MGVGKSGDVSIVAIYTADDIRRTKGPIRQTIHLAYSTDNCRTFTKYPGNPVLDVNEGKFGDPKVIWHEKTKKSVMACIRGFKKGSLGMFLVKFFRSHGENYVL